MPCEGQCPVAETVFIEGAARPAGAEETSTEPQPQSRPLSKV